MSNQAHNIVEVSNNLISYNYKNYQRLIESQPNSKGSFLVSLTKNIIVNVDTAATISSEAFGTDRMLDTVYVRRDVFEAKPVYIKNITDDTVALYFNDNDNTLWAVVEAKDKQGIWRQIEYFSANKSHFQHGDFVRGKYIGPMLLLPPGYFIKLGIPNFVGGFKTLLRIKLAQNGDTVYSNVFEGTIKLNQFRLPEGLKKRSDVLLEEPFIVPSM
ncbi:hypothetical protein [Botryobacter ruber]|uniref:hypothetical protein n=1 Tax=Botryobacter ruber TaxID=2171629 RepID=UPI000FEC7F7C|nr:hypothetical protein [Botryobacter ruber]